MFLGNWRHGSAFFRCLNEGPEGLQAVKVFACHFVLQTHEIPKGKL